MSEKLTSADQWQSCPEGTLCRIARLQRTADRRSAIMKSSFSAAASVAVAVGLVVSAGLASGSGSVKIRCPECHERFTEFHDHQTGAHHMDDSRTVEGMKTHFKKCGGCRKQFQKKYPGCPVSKNCKPRCQPAPGRELTAAPLVRQPACFPGA